MILGRVLPTPGVGIFPGPNLGPPMLTQEHQELIDNCLMLLAQNEAAVELIKGRIEIDRKEGWEQVAKVEEVVLKIYEDQINRLRAILPV